MKIHPLAELFPMMEDDALQALAFDIGTHGQREPIMLFDGAILDGRNRFHACKIAGALPKFETYGGADPLAFVISLNLKRRHLNESQRAMVAGRLANMVPHRPSNNPANLPAYASVSQPEAATLLKVSERTVRDAVRVRESAEPELARVVDQGKLAVSAAAQASKLPAAQQREIAERASAGEVNVVRTIIKQGARNSREADLGAKQHALPDAKFGVIVADPEWRFEPWSRASGLDRAADNHYPTSALDVIAARDVASISADDCILFLWATAPMLPHALIVMGAWGFDYKSHAIWVKDRLGTGYWFRNKHELLLVGTRGKIPAPAMGTQWASVIERPLAEHSAKPERFLELVEQYFPSLPKIELNRRGPAREGWKAWGNEAEGDDDAVSTESADPSNESAGTTTLSADASTESSFGDWSDLAPIEIPRFLELAGRA